MSFETVTAHRWTEKSEASDKSSFNGKLLATRLSQEMFTFGEGLSLT